MYMCVYIYIYIYTHYAYTNEHTNNDNNNNKNARACVGQRGSGRAGGGTGRSSEGGMLRFKTLVELKVLHSSFSSSSSY